MYQLPELAKAISDDKLRAAGHRQLSAQSYAARDNTTRRGIARLAGLRLVAYARRRATQAFWEVREKHLNFDAAGETPHPGDR
jgi:hypothetical protein